MKFAVVLVVVMAIVVGHRLDEEDEVPDVDIRKTDVRKEFASFVRVGDLF